MIIIIAVGIRRSQERDSRSSFVLDLPVWIEWKIKMKEVRIIK
jgi:hypothetical protein